MLRMVRSAPVAVVLLAAGCSYPSFDFDTSKTTTKKPTSTASGGGGGAGGATSTGGAGGAAADAGQGGATPPPKVECVYGTVTCDVGELCCYHSSDGNCDHCARPGNCLPFAPDAGSTCDLPGDSYYVLECARNADCDQGTICCGTVKLGDNGKWVIYGTVCSKSCQQPDNFIMCIKGADCGEPPKPCHSADYGTYGYCAK